MSKALVAFYPQAASIPTPKLKNVSRLRTEHQVYELPDPHPLLNEVKQQIQSNYQKEGVGLKNQIPCRTAMRRSFPLNGTYFQVNEAFVLSALTATSSRSFAIRAILWFFLSSASGVGALRLTPLVPPPSRQTKKNLRLRKQVLVASESKLPPQRRKSLRILKILVLQKKPRHPRPRLRHPKKILKRLPLQKEPLIVKRARLIGRRRTWKTCNRNDRKSPR
ncbi:hypothetical protein RHGRI_007140 [Rhododendron griersonianum]|uniref:Demeter RRM-fold domain-containing protein n=1 Tax=Rhododendron griersonianum TaxID=479676 RepID=A0AAV6KWW6_9ERIC|nr:hypothetical protein RHGRI_007140 [Rhododendron griersonianum]